MREVCQELHDLAVTFSNEKEKKSRDDAEVIRKIAGFIDEYNNVMLYLKNTMGYAKRKSLAEFEKEEDAESRKSFEEREFNRLSGLAYKGTMSRDFSVRSLKTKIRKIVIASPYRKNEIEKIKWVFQIGVKNPDRKGNQEELGNLKAGYLYLDNEILKNKLTSHYQDIIRLFAHSTDNGKIMTNGIAVKLIHLIDGYVKITNKNEKGDKDNPSPGIIAKKTQALDSKFKRLNRRLESTRKNNEKKVANFNRKLRKLSYILPIADVRRKRFENTFGNNTNQTNTENNSKNSHESE